MQIQDMNDLFLHTLKDVYYAENEILKALPKMAKKAGEPKLREALEHHVEETKSQVERLKEVFKLLDQKPAGDKCPAIEGIVKEAEEIMGHTKDADTLDAAMIAAQQAVEHYEITRYGTLISWADELKMPEAGKLLKQTLKEEKDTDAKLTKLAEQRVNASAPLKE